MTYLACIGAALIWLFLAATVYSWILSPYGKRGTR